MHNHPALTPGRVAVITGGASGIGLAVARRLAAIGMHVVLADADERVDEAARKLSAGAAGTILGEGVDVSDPAAMIALAQRVRARFGDVAFLMNNAGLGGGGRPFENPEGWARVLAVNLNGPINGVQAFVPEMIEQGKPAVVVNTGSKQGITSPPGDVAYNTSKAALKSMTEGLAHSLREIEGCRVSAHLLIPGFTYTGMMERYFKTKPDAAWTADEVADALLAGLAADRFYILCGDNETPRSLDERRILWAAGDIVHDRPALSRWHPDFKDAYAAFIAAGEAGSPTDQAGE